MQGKYALYVRSKDGTLAERITDYTSLKMLLTLNDPGSWSLESVSPEMCPFGPGDGIVVIRNGAFFFGGVMMEMSDVFDATTGLYHWTAQGKGDLEYLHRRICSVNPASSNPTSRAYYTDSGQLSAVIRNLIRLNLGPGALTSRQESVIADHQQAGAGPSVSVSLRFQNLLDAVTALVSGNGWNIRACWDNDAEKIYYEIYQGRDLTADVIFTEQLNNILSSEHLLTVPEGNSILAGGTGQGTSRSFSTVRSDESISQWGLIEQFQDARNQTSVSTFAADVLAERIANTYGFACEASQDDFVPQFGVDYMLGDIVGMKVFGQFVTAEVQQCEINVANGIEEVEPRFGTVAIGKLKSVFRQLKDLRADVDELLGKEVE